MERFTVRHCGVATIKNKKFKEAAEALAKYEEAEDQGRMLLLPCKIGDTVYEISSGIVEEMKVTGFRFGRMMSEDEEEYSDDYAGLNGEPMIHIECECNEGDFESVSEPVILFGKMMFGSKTEAIEELMNQNKCKNVECIYRTEPECEAQNVCPGYVER